MKKIFTLIFALIALQLSAVTVPDVAGTFRGTLLIDDEEYPNEKIYILPGTENNTITFVLPNFKFNGAPLGDIVLVDVPMTSSGELTISDRELYIKILRARAYISSTGSTLSESSAQIGLSISVASVPMPIPVTFSGSKITTDNYAVTNGGFEGNWTNNEPAGWHSFASATGQYASFVSGNTAQFTQSADIRPGSTGSHSAKIESKYTVGVKANGNCTNGQINAGSMSATDAKGNYGFSEPDNSGYNTPFVGNPDSLVFWAKYVPGGGNLSDENNKARAHAVLITAARYQDPETSDYSAVKIADAAINYSAAADTGWQRLSVPFEYTELNPALTEYMLITFTTNQEPGGGNSTKKSPDDVYLDDVEMVYNHSLASFSMDGAAVTFSDGQAVSELEFSDSDYTFAATSDGKAAKTFIGFDAANSRVQVYVVADNYSQALTYSLYTLQMASPVKDTEYAYSATTCDNEPYSDNLFQNLTESGEYTTTIPNSRGGDSVITFTLTVLPSYRFEETKYVNEADLVWRGKTIKDLPKSAEPYHIYDSLTAVNGCDSLFVLILHVSEIPVTYGFYDAVICEGEFVKFEGVKYREAFEGDIHVAAKNQYGGDSIVHLTVTVLPSYTIDEYMTITVGDEVEWEGWNLSTMPEGKITLSASYYTDDDCDSTLVLHLTVEPEEVITALEEVSNDQLQTTNYQKLLINGKLFIIRKDEIYDILGTKIK